MPAAAATRSIVGATAVALPTPRNWPGLGNTTSRRPRFCWRKPTTRTPTKNTPTTKMRITATTTISRATAAHEIVASEIVWPEKLAPKRPLARAAAKPNIARRLGPAVRLLASKRHLRAPRGFWPPCIGIAMACRRSGACWARPRGAARGALSFQLAGDRLVVEPIGHGSLLRGLAADSAAAGLNAPKRVVARAPLAKQSTGPDRRDSFADGFSRRRRAVSRCFFPPPRREFVRLSCRCLPRHRPELGPIRLAPRRFNDATSRR